MIHQQTTAEQRQSDRRNAVDYGRAATRLRNFARHYQALSAEVTPDPTLASFGPTVAAYLRNSYEDMAVYLNTAADQADELADTYRAHLGVA